MGEYEGEIIDLILINPKRFPIWKIFTNYAGDNVEEYRNVFDKWIASFTNLPEKVVVETFRTGLLSWIKTEVDFCEPKGLAQMMQITQKVENREDVRREANLPRYFGGRQQKIPLNTNKMNNNVNVRGNKGYSSWPMRTITLQGTSIGEV